MIGSELKKYTAVTRSGSPIISVSAANMEDGRKKIIEKLNGNGRAAWSTKWVQDGELIIME